MADDVARGRCRVATRALRCLWHEIRAFVLPSSGSSVACPPAASRSSAVSATLSAITPVCHPSIIRDTGMRCSPPSSRSHPGFLAATCCNRASPSRRIFSAAPLQIFCMRPRTYHRKAPHTSCQQRVVGPQVGVAVRRDAHQAVDVVGDGAELAVLRVLKPLCILLSNIAKIVADHECDGIADQWPVGGCHPTKKAQQRRLIGLRRDGLDSATRTASCRGGGGGR
jgi:hypothetical protein